MLCLLIVDDHRLVASGMGLVLQSLPGESGVECLQANTCAEAFELIKRHRNIDLMLLDYQMPDMNGIDALRVIRDTCPDLPVLMVTGQLDIGAAAQVKRAGASGFLSKSGDAQELLLAVKTVLAGDEYWPKVQAPFGIRSVGETLPFSTLSLRQLDVLRLLVADASTQDIHRALFIAEPTVKYHVREILKKLRVPNRSKAVALAIQAGIPPLYALAFGVVDQPD